MGQVVMEELTLHKMHRVDRAVVVASTVVAVFFKPTVATRRVPMAATETMASKVVQAPSVIMGKTAQRAESTFEVRLPTS